MSPLSHDLLAKVEKKMKMLLGTTLQERRLFRRIKLKLVAEVSVTGEKETAPTDKVRILDISGNGVRFTSRNSEFYHVGQIIEISIRLPGKSGVKACMRGLGSVVRIQAEPAAGMPSLKNKEVAISLDTPLSFVRSI
ncbi:MAG: hypothetical protein CVU57_28940 [Deltaproteobacteria bacterium HGW-Deltaproteobacteria-15]|jgi:hypothetical protein|nr:MAG: hypothetical protein CVU57_28940 [Deltaproteobacteria bacterium HGW-Deltaproteobacteria-15]